MLCTLPPPASSTHTQGPSPIPGHPVPPLHLPAPSQPAPGSWEATHGSRGSKKHDLHQNKSYGFLHAGRKDRLPGLACAYADSPTWPPARHCRVPPDLAVVLVGGSWPQQGWGLCSGAGGTGQEPAVARCHGGAVGHGMCQRSHLASLPAAWLIPAPAHSPWLPLSSADGRGAFGDGGRRAPVTLPRGQPLGSLMALFGDPNCPGPLIPQPAPAPGVAARPWSRVRPGTLFR